MSNLFGVSAQYWLWFDQFFTLISFSLLAFGFWKRDLLRYWIARNQFSQVGDSNNTPLPEFDGLVFTVSNSGLPVWVIGKMDPKPKAVALLHTEESRSKADQIISDKSLEGVTFYKFLIEDGDNPAMTKVKAKQALRLLQGEVCERLAVDVTGGKVPMSLGAFMAAEEEGASTIYVSSQYVAGGLPKTETSRIIQISSHD